MGWNRNLWFAGADRRGHAPAAGSAALPDAMRLRPEADRTVVGLKGYALPDSRNSAEGVARPKCWNKINYPAQAKEA
jgi:hypothetical protein